MIDIGQALQSIFNWGDQSPLVSPVPQGSSNNSQDMKLTTTVSPNFVNQAQSLNNQMQQTTPQPQVAINNRIGQLVQQYWPQNEWGNWYKAMQGENSNYDPIREYHNSDGSIDRGIMQINSNTFNDFMHRQGPSLQKMGISSFDDMFDPAKNIQMGRIVHQEQGWNAWHGAPKELK